MFEHLFAQGGLSLERLRVLVEVESAGSIVGAAGSDPVRQSQFSRQLRELSEFFGVELVLRSGRNVKLTAEGIQLASIAREKLVQLEDFFCDCAARGNEFTVGAGDSLIQWIVVPSLARIRKVTPPPMFRLVSLRTGETISAVQEFRLDVGLVRSDAVPSALSSFRAGRLDFVVVIPRSMVPRDLEPTLGWCFETLPVATQIGDGQFTQRLREIAEGKGARLSLALACESFTQALSALLSGEYAAVLPKVAVKKLPADKWTIVEDKDLRALSREIDLVWNPRFLAVRKGGRKVLDSLRTAVRAQF